MYHKRAATFLVFLAYTTAIFFLPNSYALIMVLIINLGLGIIWRIDWRKLGRSLFRILPFVLITVVFNVWLDTWENAVFVALKLLLVSQMTLSYAQTLTSLEFAKMLGKLLWPLSKIGVKTGEIELMVCIALSLMPILRDNVREMRGAVIAKGRKVDLSNMRYVVQKLAHDSFRRIDEIDAALIAKGVQED